MEGVGVAGLDGVHDLVRVAIEGLERKTLLDRFGEVVCARGDAHSSGVRRAGVWVGVQGVVDGAD